MNASAPRLTSLAHGGGCGCKLAPSVLRELLADQPATASFADLIVGTETGDDAAVWRLDDETNIVATTDFFMPMVDDPFDFGRIAATNALSDVYAMGGRPIFALAILGMPIDKMPTATIREVLRGGAEAAAAAGIPVAGGHSIDSPEPIYGLAVIGLVSREGLRLNCDARPGDALILTKPIGVGIYSAAIKKGALSDEGYREMLGFMTRLNAVGAELAKDERVHAMTDVTGFGMIGHAREMALASDVGLRLKASAMPLLPGARACVAADLIPGGLRNNRDFASSCVSVAPGVPEDLLTLLYDPQTAGGLLVAIGADEADGLVAALKTAGIDAARVGDVVPRTHPIIHVEP